MTLHKLLFYFLLRFLLVLLSLLSRFLFQFSHLTFIAFIVTAVPSKLVY